MTTVPNAPIAPYGNPGRMTRVLHCIPSMGGGGAERELAYLSGGLQRAGTDVHVALFGHGPNFERLEHSGAELHPVTIANNYDPRLLMRLDGIIRAVRPDVVQTWLTQMDVAAGFVATVRRIPWILSERASALFYDRTVKNFMRVTLARNAALIQANSVEGTRYWQRVLPRIRTKVIPSPVPAAEIARVPVADLAAAGKREGVPLILFAGRLHEQKNIRTTLEALALVLRARPGAVALCGEGPQADDIRNWLSELGIAGRVTTPGYVNDIWSWMKAADVFVSVSHYEGRPNTVAEAAAAGCPLVVSDIPEHREFLQHRVHALLVDRHQPAAIAAAIGEVLDDREAALQRAGAARRVAAEWDVDRIAAVHAAMYEDVLRDRPRIARANRERR